MRIYLASVYNAFTLTEKEANVNKVIEVAVELIQRGYNVFVPHLTHYVDMKARELGISISNKRWIDLDLEWLSFCDAMLVLSNSPGVEREIGFAKDYDIPIFYSVKELKEQYGI